MQELEMVKVVTENVEIKIVYKDGIYQAFQNGEVIYQDDNYEQVRFVAIGW